MRYFPPFFSRIFYQKGIHKNLVLFFFTSFLHN